jgi:hypothetical protein
MHLISLSENPSLSEPATGPFLAVTLLLRGSDEYVIDQELLLEPCLESFYTEIT